MAWSSTTKASAQTSNLSNGTLKAEPSKYVALGDFLTGEDAYNKPEVRELLVKTYGDQGITGFLTLTGAVKNAGQADQIEWFEEKRRHRRLKAKGVWAVTDGVATGGTFDDVDGTNVVPQVYDVIMRVADGHRFLVTESNGVTAAYRSLGNSAYGTDVADNDEFALIGNMYPQGSDQPTRFVEPGLQRYVNPFAIVKERFQVNGSQATNIGWINVGNGDYRWFMYGEQEARKRFMDKREMTLLFGDVWDGASATAADVRGTEGYFSAVEKRGNIFGGSFASMQDIDDIIIELDKQGAPAEYAMYLNRTFDLAIDDLLANGIATQVTAGLPGQFGAFNNNADMAVKLGFKSFTRGGYTFHKHSWKLLNDPTLLAGSIYAGAMVPMTQVMDPRTGTKAPALEMNYKAANGYSRELNHWITGGDVLGYTNNGDTGKDVATYHYRSEVNLITRAANQHVILKTS